MVHLFMLLLINHTIYETTRTQLLFLLIELFVMCYSFVETLAGEGLLSSSSECSITDGSTPGTYLFYLYIPVNQTSKL